MKALSDNFKADIKKNGPDPLHVFIHSAKRSALQDTQWAQRLDENVINPCKTLLRTYSDQTDPTDTSATGVLEHAKTAITIAQQFAKLKLVEELLTAKQPSEIPPDFNVDMSNPLQHGKTGRSGLPADIDFAPWFNQRDMNASLRSAIDTAMEVVLREKRPKLTGEIALPNDGNPIIPQIESLSQQPISSWPKIERVVEVLASLRAAHCTSAKSWIENLHRIFPNEHSAMQYLGASLSTPTTSWSRMTFWPDYPLVDNLLGLNSNDDSVHEWATDDGLRKVLDFKLPKESFSTDTWATLLIQEPQLSRFLRLADKVDEYARSQGQEHPKTTQALKSLILETCIDALPLRDSTETADRLRFLLRHQIHGPNFLTPSESVRRAYVIPVKCSAENTLSYLEALLDLGLFGDACTVAGPKLLLVSDRDDHESYLDAVKCLSVLGKTRQPDTPSSYYHLDPAENTQAASIRFELVKMFTKAPRDGNEPTNDAERVLKWGPLECNMKQDFRPNVLARFDLSRETRGYTWADLAHFPDFCSTLVTVAKYRAVSNVLKEHNNGPGEFNGDFALADEPMNVTSNESQE